MRSLVEPRNYRALSRIDTYEERFAYLHLQGSVGASTFGFERWRNQAFYTSTEWKQVRNEVIARDRGLDLGCEGYEIYDKIIVHHMNPMDPHTIDNEADILNPDYLVCCTLRTHNAIHFGDARQLTQGLVERQPGDMIPWR